MPFIQALKEIPLDIGRARCRDRLEHHETVLSGRIESFLGPDGPKTLSRKEIPGGQVFCGCVQEQPVFARGPGLRFHLRHEFSTNAQTLFFRRHGNGKQLQNAPDPLLIWETADHGKAGTPLSHEGRQGEGRARVEPAQDHLSVRAVSLEFMITKPADEPPVRKPDEIGRRVQFLIECEIAG